MTTALAVSGPYIDWAAASPLIALTGGAVLVLMLGVFGSEKARVSNTFFFAIATMLTTIGLCVWQWGTNTGIIAGALAVDDLMLTLTVLFCIGGTGAMLLSMRSLAAREAGHGEYYSLIITSILGMVVLVGAQNLVMLFLGFELLSIPLYVLCATELHRPTSLESGLKYLIVGSVGSVTLLYGLALIFGATGSTDFSGIATAAQRVSGDALFLTGVGLVVVGLAFKASVAPFHQWTPDVYEGAPSPITAFMAVATKAAAFGVLLRLFDVALIGAASDWAPALAALAAITIVVGNIGAIGQSSLKRLLAYSGVAQAGYLLTGVVVSTQLGIAATVYYLCVYLVMNIAAFAVIVARERASIHGDDISSFRGLGSSEPWLAWPMTIAMLGLAGIPATAGFFGKIYLIEAAVDNSYAWLGVMIVIGSALSMVYYLRVIATMWMQPAEDAPAVTASGQPVIAGGSSGQGSQVQIEVRFVAVACAAATLFFGIYPEPLFNVAKAAGSALTNLL